MTKTMTKELGASIVIPTFNTRDLLKKNIPEVLKAKDNVNNHIDEVIVVDDCSKDGSYEFLKNNFPQVKLIRHKINRGFSASVNTGVRTAKGDLVVLLNSDVVPSEDFLIKALTHFKDKDIFAVSLHEEGFGWALGRFEKGYVVHAPVLSTEKAHETFWVNGGSGVFRRSYWINLGGMDEKVFPPFYWEDVDLSYRALKRGWKLIWEPEGIVFHQHESTIGKISPKYRQRIQERNQLVFIWKNITSANLFKKHLIGLFKRVIRHPGYIRIVFMALLKTKTILKLRKKEKKESKVSDEAIFARFN